MKVVYRSFRCDAFFVPVVIADNVPRIWEPKFLFENIFTVLGIHFEMPTSFFIVQGILSRGESKMSVDECGFVTI